MTPAVREGRTGPTIGVTGAAGTLGAAVACRLVHHEAVGRVVGLDTARRPVPGLSWLLADVRDPTLAHQLTGIDTVVHLATDRTLLAPPEPRRAVNVRGTESLLDAATSAGVRRVVLLTSATVYGASRVNPVPLDEDGPLLAAPGDGLIGDWLAMEHLAAVRHDRIEVTSVRPASLVGPQTDGPLGSLFESVRLLAIRDARCHWQFCHLDDLLDALVAAAVGSVRGAVTVGCDGWLERDDVERISGLRSVVIPASVAVATAARLHRVGVIRSPASDLDYLIHPWVVGSQRLRATGWTPAWTNEAALRDHLSWLGDRAGRGLLRVDRKDATRAAAGATLALLGSLAIARSRGRRP